MQYTDDRFHLRVDFDVKQFQLPADELTRMEESLAPLGEEVKSFAHSDLCFDLIHHPRSNLYHVEAKLKLPGRTLFTGDWDAYLDTAYQRCLRKLIQKVKDYRQQPNQPAEDTARRETALGRDIVIPQGPDEGPLAAAVQAGDYRTFRNTLVGYEDWLRKRVGRWVQRYPDAQARVGDGLLIGDMVEEVYLNAFERYPHRQGEVSLSDWLDSLIDPSVKALLRNPADESENASFARTVREMPAAQTR